MSPFAGGALFTKRGTRIATHQDDPDGNAKTKTSEERRTARIADSPIRAKGRPMIGLVIVTHGALADEFREALEHVVGKQPFLATVPIGPEDNGEMRRSDILEAVARVDSGDGVILLTDMFGGTPSNLAISVMDEAPVEVIAGVNLPLLVKLASIRNDLPLKQAVAEAREAGRKYISVASEVLAGES